MNVRATSATFLFFAFGVLSLLIPLPHREELAWYAIFYALLLVNTFFSIQYFSEIIPTDIALQRVADGTLVLCYAAIAIAMGYALYFGLFLLLLFIVATLKYWSAEPVVVDTRLLTRKVKFDFLGVLMALLFLTITLFGYPRPAVIALDVVYGIANVYLLFVKPLYQKPPEALG